MTPPAPPTGIQDAARLLAEGQSASAEALLDQLVRAFPTHVTAHVLLAKAREANGRSERALEAWHAAHFLMPGSPLVARERARLLRSDLGDTAPAEPASVAEPVEATVLEPEAIEADAAEPEVAEERTEPESEQHEASQPEAEPHAALHSESEMAEPETTPEPDGADLGVETDRSESEPIVGSAPDACVRDVQPGAPDTTAEDTRAPDTDWKIIGETAAPRAVSDEPIEPAVAPPVGHRATHPTATPSAPGRMSENEFTAAPTASGEDQNEADDLDTLIEQLENAPRIRPDLNALDDDEDDADAEEIELVSETLARIYAAQGQYDEAARAYEQLASKHPGRATELLGKAAEMRRAAGAGH